MTQSAEIGAHFVVAEDASGAHEIAERLERGRAREFLAVFRLDRAHQRLRIAVADVDENAIQRLRHAVAEELDRLALADQPAQRRIGALVAFFAAEMDDVEEFVHRLLGSNRARGERAQSGDEARRRFVPMVERPLHRRARRFIGLDKLAQGFVDVHGRPRRLEPEAI